MKVTPRKENVEIIKNYIFKIDSKENDTITKKIERIITLENHYYQLTEDKEHLFMAVDHIMAYLELGYKYDILSELFNDTLTKLETSKDEVFSQKLYRTSRIRCNKTQIEIMLGRWHFKKGELKKPEVIADIIKHVVNNDIGSYTYNETRGKFVLVITPNEVYGHRITAHNEEYFTFIK